MTKNLHTLLKQFVPAQEEWKLQLLNNWNSIIGDLNNHVRLEKIHDATTLVLGVYDASWLHELYFLTPLLLKKINDQLDKPRIKTIRFVQTVKTEPTPFKKISAQPEKPKVVIVLSPQEEKALNHITDEQLKQALKNFLARCRQ